MSYKLLNVINPPPIDGKTYMVGVLYLSPNKVASKVNVCPFATEGCKMACLNTAGRGALRSVQDARKRRTLLFHSRPSMFFAWLRADIAKLVRAARRDGKLPVVKLNGTSDIRWEDHTLIPSFPQVQFYDYTMYPPLTRKALPSNYHLTYSFSENRRAQKWAQGWFERGGNVAVVFRGPLPETFLGKSVINGDEHDLRFLDPKGVIVGLKAKGVARHSYVHGFTQTPRRDPAHGTQPTPINPAYVTATYEIPSPLTFTFRHAR